VKVVFGIPGVHNLSLFEALRRSNIRVVSATHEQAVGFMASGYSRTTGTTGVFVTVPGPGFTNAFTSIAESFLDSCAVVCIMTGVRNDIDQKFQLHEIQQIDLAKPIAKAVFTVSRADQVFELTEGFFRLRNQANPDQPFLRSPQMPFGSVSDPKAGPNAMRRRQANSEMVKWSLPRS
jgi:acetolactate synthase-1/2/3 large subunit